MSEVDIAEANDAPAEAAVIDPTEVMQSVAAEMGWSPKEKWKGNPDEWRDAPDFLRKTPGMIKATKRQLETVTRLATEQVEKAQRDAIKNARAKIAEGAANGDAELAEEGAVELERASIKPDKAVTEWAAKNDWFDPVSGDAGARAVALAAAEKVYKDGGTVAAQIAAGEQAARKRYPELFEDDEALEPEPVARRQPPQVQGGQRASTSASREKGWHDLPAGVKAAANPKFLRTFNLTPEGYAKSYFAEQAKGNA